MWLYAFREYAPTEADWGKYAILTPGRLSTAFPQHVHVEPTRFFRPSWREADKIYKGFYDWSQNYVMHLWNKVSKTFKIPQSPSEIPEVGKMTCTLHELFRYIYYNQTHVHAKERNPT